LFFSSVLFLSLLLCFLVLGVWVRREGNDWRGGAKKKKKKKWWWVFECLYSLFFLFLILYLKFNIHLFYTHLFCLSI
jgi:ABC-type Fe3+ transport system permease subunit